MLRDIRFLKIEAVWRHLITCLFNVMDLGSFLFNSLASKRVVNDPAGFPWGSIYGFKYDLI